MYSKKMDMKNAIEKNLIKLKSLETQILIVNNKDLKQKIANFKS